MKVGDFAIYQPFPKDLLNPYFESRIGKKVKITRLHKHISIVAAVFEGQSESNMFYENRLKLIKENRGHHLTTIFK